MIKDLKRYERICCDDITTIENYNKMINDNSNNWVLHHKLEIDLNKTRKELIEMNLYYNRPASELIFVTRSEHNIIHYKNKPRTEEQKLYIKQKTKEAMWKPEIRKKHLANCLRGEDNPMYGKSPLDSMTEDAIKEWRLHISESRKGKSTGPQSEETKRKRSEKMKGRERGPFSEEHKSKLKQSALNRWAREKNIIKEKD